LITVGAPTTVDDNFDGLTATTLSSKFRQSMNVYLGDLAENSVYLVSFNPQGNVVATAWAKSATDTIIGTYPKLRTVAQNTANTAVLASGDPAALAAADSDS
jgi:hypothetical protein